MNSTESKSNVLEKILVNWATPYEIIVCKMLKTFLGEGVINPGFREYFHQHGIAKGLWKSKIDDYERLIDVSTKRGDIPERVMQLYDKTACGYVMIGVNHIFRR